MHRTCFRGSILACSLLTAGSGLFLPSLAQAQETLVTGQVALAEGHEVPTCRRVKLHADSGNDMWFRLPDTGTDNSILAVALTALTASRKVQVAYNPALTSGCGTEPKILYISILGN